MATFTQVLISGILVGGIYALITVGVTFVFGVMNVVNFAHGEFVMFGGYFAYFLSLAGVNLWVSLILAIPLSFLAGMVLQRLLIRPLQDHQLMQIFGTFGLLLLMQNFVLIITSGQPKSINDSYSQAAINIGSVAISVPQLVVFLVATALTIGLRMFLRRTVVGTAIRAVSTDKRAARLMGINVEMLYMITMGIGITLAGIGGVLLAPVYSLTPEFGFSFMLPAFVAAILGGMGSIPGAYIGGLIIGILEGVIGYYLAPSLGEAAAFLVLIIVLVVRPWGLLGSRAQAERATL
jgi:branched-chain amino acid transport system permease protein